MNSTNTGSKNFGPQHICCLLPGKRRQYPLVTSCFFSSLAYIDTCWRKRRQVIEIKSKQKSLIFLPAMNPLTGEALTFNEISIKCWKDQDHCNEVSFLFIKIILLPFVLGIQSYSEYTRGFEEASCAICKFST